mmetsp:Transcript_6163/g.9043  ORF Transcript_6163/g.9043 Transcript_6163/m.9043 type:complete len:548 (+) Transcript_6163:17-1660(+)
MLSRLLPIVNVLLLLGISLHTASALLIIRPNRNMVTLSPFRLTSQQASFQGLTRTNAQPNENFDEQKEALYRQVLEDQTKREIVQNCSVFSKLTPDDLDRVSRKLQKKTISKGTKVISQGDEGHEIYFVAEGEFEFRLDGKPLAGKCGEGQFFGELAVFFQKNRAVDVVATQSSSVWVLSRADFLDAAQESSVDREAFKALMKSYRLNKKPSAVSIAKNLDLKDVWDLVVLKSRPKKKPVSFHSSACIFALGIFSTALLPLFSPGLDVNGLPRIWNVSGHNSLTTLRQMQIASWMMTLTGAMGLPRIPRSAPQSRRLLFWSAVKVNLFLSIYVSSNLTGLPVAFLDAFSFPGNALVVTSGLLNWVGTLSLLDDSIAGPMKGRHTIALTGSRWSSVFFYLAMSIIAMFFLPLIMPVVVSDLASYNRVATYIREGAEGSQLSLFVLIQAMSWISSFFTTLLFEKKLRPKTANSLAGIVVLGLLFDPMLIALAGLFSPSSIVGGEDMLLYFRAITKRCAINRVGFSMIFLTVVNAARKVIFRRQGTASST